MSTQQISKIEAIRRLTNRFYEQCRANPLTNLVSLDDYIKTNLHSVMKFGLLKDYSMTPFQKGLVDWYMEGAH